MDICPQCESKKVRVYGKGVVLLFGFLVMSMGCWITLILPPIGIVMVVVGIVLMCMTPFSKKVKQCQDCKKTWR